MPGAKPCLEERSSWVDSDLTCKYQTRLEKLAKEKRSSLFGLFAGDEKSCMTLDYFGQCYETFYLTLIVRPSKLERLSLTSLSGLV